MLSQEDAMHNIICGLASVYLWSASLSSALRTDALFSIGCSFFY